MYEYICDNTALRLLALSDKLDKSGKLGNTVSLNLFKTYFGQSKSNIADTKVLGANKETTKKQYPL
jgi:hypothetical protein